MARWIYLAIAMGLCAGVAQASDGADQYDDDVRAFRRLINIDVQDEAAYDHMVDVLEENGVLAAEPEKFTRAVSKILYRNRIQAYQNLGVALQKKGYENQSRYLFDIYSRFRPAKNDEPLQQSQATARNNVYY